MEVTYRKLKLEVKVLCWEAKALENMKADSRAEGGKRLYKRFCLSLKPQIWAICITPSISSSDKGLIARSSVGKRYVKINQSQSIRTEKRARVLSPSLLACISHFLFSCILLQQSDRLSYYTDNQINRFLHYVRTALRWFRALKQPELTACFLGMRILLPVSEYVQRDIKSVQ